MEKKAIIEFVGRLGNQFYIYSTALQLKKIGYMIKYDFEYFNWWPKKKKFKWFVELDKFNVNLPKATKKEIRKLIWRTNNRYINSWLKRKKYFSPKAVWLKNRRDYENFPNKVYVIGFDSSYDFIKKNKNELQKAFELKEKYKKRIKPLLDLIKEKNSVAINVRRGDLIKFKDAHILPIDYYKKAVKIIKEQVENPVFYISSDEISWCKKNFDWLENKTFLERFDAPENFEICKSCKHAILANSTFSLWVAFLNNNKNKIIIAPKQFYYRYKDKNKRKNFNPEEWVWINEK